MPPKKTAAAATKAGDALKPTRTSNRVTKSTPAASSSTAEVKATARAVVVKKPAVKHTKESNESTAPATGGARATRSKTEVNQGVTKENTAYTKTAAAASSKPVAKKNTANTKKVVTTPSKPVTKSTANNKTAAAPSKPVTKSVANNKTAVAPSKPVAKKTTASKKTAEASQPKTIAKKVTANKKTAEAAQLEPTKEIKKRKATEEAAAPTASGLRTAKRARTSPEEPAQEEKRRNAGRERIKAQAAQAKKPKPRAPEPIINERPTQRLHIFVFGEGSSGELGLGTAKNAVDVKRPRLNPLLPADTVGVVQLAVGGMHCAALTYENKILTWGVNDQCALGRDTTWDGGLRDMDVDDDDSDAGSDSGLNPREATPTALPANAFPEGTQISKVAAGDSTTFAITDTGHVYGWGTFRDNEGILGFTEKIKIQPTPMLIPELKKIKDVAVGANHALALTEKGNVLAWGCGQQNQLGRRIVNRGVRHGLVPREVGGLPHNKIVQISCGQNHCFAVDKAGAVWTWGMNNFGETGIADGAGQDGATVMTPMKVEALQGYDLREICGGGHHSIAVTQDGDCLVWGRIDGFQCGIKLDALPDEAVVRDGRGNPRILAVPTAIPGLKAKTAAAGSDNGFLLTPEGRAYSWGFSANYQTGQGVDEDVETATLIDNTAVRGRALNWAGAGGQFSVLTAPAAPVP